MLLLACTAEPGVARSPATAPVIAPSELPCRVDLRLPAAAEPLQLDPVPFVAPSGATAGAATSEAAASRLQFSQPEEGAGFSAAALSAAKVVLQLTAAAAADSGGRVLVGVDAYRARPWVAGTDLSLADLVPADSELQPGWHRLIGMNVATNGQLTRAADASARESVVVRQFWIGEHSPAEPAPTPILVYNLPTGTYPAAAAEGAAERGPLLDFAWLAPTAPIVLVEVRAGRARRAALLQSAGAFRLPQLGAGDFEVSLTTPRYPSAPACAEARAGAAPDPRLIERVSQTVTSNGDDPQAPPR